MDCSQTEPRLQALLDSRQDIDSDDELRRHLEQCDECATLAATYDALAQTRPLYDSEPPLAGLASRVVAEVTAPPPAKAPATWRAWTAMATAASLLVACGVALREEPNAKVAPAAVEVPVVVAQPPATEAVAAAVDDQLVVADESGTETTPHEFAGHDMWYRTGKSLASISLVSLRSQRRSSSDADNPSDVQLLDRAYNTLRWLWPGEAENASPTRGETGWHDSTCDMLVG